MTMVRSKVMKRTSRKSKILESIPIELLTEIVARVAAFSSNDFFNVKLSCKLLNKVAHDKYVFQHVSLVKIPLRPWFLRERASSFLNECTKSGNPEALYRQGVKEYLGNVDRMESSMQCLWRAANSGHLGALYAIGIILLLHGDGFQQEGMKIISEMKKLKKTRIRVRECRENFKELRGRSWPDSSEERPRICKTHVYGSHVGWTPFEDVDLDCQSCMCDQEIASIF